MSKCLDCNKQLIKKRKGGHICDECYDKFWKVTQPIGYELGRLATIKELEDKLNANLKENKKTTSDFVRGYRNGILVALEFTKEVGAGE